MRPWHWLLFAVGLLALLIGAVWIGQGTGVFPYPRQSFMIGQRHWASRGAVIALAGLGCIVLSRVLPKSGRSGVGNDPR